MVPLVNGKIYKGYNRFDLKEGCKSVSITGIISSGGFVSVYIMDHVYDYV